MCGHGVPHRRVMRPAVDSHMMLLAARWSLLQKRRETLAPQAGALLAWPPPIYVRSLGRMACLMLVCTCWEVCTFAAIET